MDIGRLSQSELPFDVSNIPLTNYIGDYIFLIPSVNPGGVADRWGNNLVNPDFVFDFHFEQLFSNPHDMITTYSQNPTNFFQSLIDFSNSVPDDLIHVI